MTKRIALVATGNAPLSSDSIKFTIGALEAATWSNVITKTEAQQLISMRHRACLEPTKCTVVPRRLREPLARFVLFAARPASRSLH